MITRRLRRIEDTLPTLNAVQVIPSADKLVLVAADRYSIGEYRRGPRRTHVMVTIRPDGPALSDWMAWLRKDDVHRVL